MGRNIILHVPHDSFDISGADSSRFHVVDYFISCEKGKRIIISFERFDYGKYVRSEVRIEARGADK